MPESNEKRRQPQQRRAQETVDVVLQGAVRVLGREGVDSVTTNRIADAAGVSIGSLYQYFKDKQAIFEALHERHAQRVRAVLERTLEARRDAPVESLVLGLLDALIDEHAAEPKELHLLLAERPAEEFGLRDALKLILDSRSCSRGTRFVIPGLLDTLVHEAVLARPRGLSLEAAKAEASRAIRGYLAEP